MQLIFIIFTICLETALIVLTLAKQNEKALWLRNRALTRAIEFVLLLGVILLPLTHMKWRYIGALILVGILLLIAGLCWLIKRRKVNGSAKKARVITSGLLSVFMIGFALVPAFVFTNYDGLRTTGDYTVRESNAVLTDANRVDPFEGEGSDREVPVHFYYPDAEGSFPLIVFSHGAFGYYQSNYSTYAELVSHGYVVAALDHPHHAFFTKNSLGELVTVDSGFLSEALDVTNGVLNAEDTYALYDKWMSIRTGDVNFVLDTIETAKATDALDAAWHTENEAEILSVLKMTDTDRIGVIGHSMGGATAVNIGRVRNDIDAVIVLDGTMLGEITGLENGVFLYNEEPYSVPVLDFGKKSDYSEIEQATDERESSHVNQYMIEHAKDGKQVLFGDCEHMDFTDLPLFSPLLASLLGSKDIDHEAFMCRLNGLVLRWFDSYLKGIGTPDIKAEY